MSDSDPLFYPFYEHLSDNEKNLYNQVLTGLNIVKDVIKPAVKVNFDETTNVIKAIMYDHPELFWFTGSAATSLLNNNVAAIKPEYNHLAKNLNQHKLQLKQSADKYLKFVHGKDPHEQERLIHDKMVQTISYVRPDLDQTSYAALVEEKAVCAGYTRAFQLLMQRLGIPCYYCSGTAIGPEDKEWTRHAWNIVKLDDDYYNLDITWNDCYDKADKNHISYAFYNCTDLQIMDSHKRAEKHAFLPICSGEKYSFGSIYGIPPELELIYQDGVTCKTPVSNRLEFQKEIKAALKSGKGKNMVISLPAKGEKVKDNCGGWFKEAAMSAFPNKGWKMNSTITDYKNGWYKMEFSIKFM